MIPPFPFVKIFTRATAVLRFPTAKIYGRTMVFGLSFLIVLTFILNVIVKFQLFRVVVLRDYDLFQ